MSWRDLGAGEVRPGNVGERHTLAGWVARRRDHGGLIFVDLRDETGICQLVVNPEHSPEAAKQAHAIRNEFVLQAEGEVAARAPENVNPDLPTGEVELQVDRLEILSRCTPLPFQLDEEGVDETLRLRYRWIDLRRVRLQRNLRLRSGFHLSLILALADLYAFRTALIDLIIHQFDSALDGLGGSPLKVEDGLLQRECAALFREWKQAAKCGTY